MSNLPEEMFVQRIRKLNCDEYSLSPSAINPETIFGSEMQEQRYVRADLYEALKAENEKLQKALRHVTTQRVLDTRGSYDVPGFDVCVDAEMEMILKCGGE